MEVFALLLVGDCLRGGQSVAGCWSGEGEHDLFS